MATALTADGPKTAVVVMGRSDGKAKADQVVAAHDDLVDQQQGPGGRRRACHRHNQGDGDGDAGADHRGEDVAAEVVGADQWMRGAWRRCRGWRRRRGSRRRRGWRRRGRPPTRAPPRRRVRVAAAVRGGVGEVGEVTRITATTRAHHHAHHHDQVALTDRLDEPAEAGEEEDVLVVVAREQEGELQADDEHRDQGVAERVAAERLATGQAFGHRDEVLAERVDERRAR